MICLRQLGTQHATMALSSDAVETSGEKLEVEAKCITACENCRAKSAFSSKVVGRG